MNPFLRLWAYLLAVSALRGSCSLSIQVLVQSLPPATPSAARGLLAASDLFVWPASRKAERQA